MAVRLGKIFADLNGRNEFARERGSAAVVVVPDRLFDPVDAFAVERAPALERLVDAQRLIEVDHDPDGGRHARPHRMQRRDIFLERRIAQAQFHRAESALEQLFRFVRERGSRHQAQAATVVSRYRPPRAAQVFDERHLSRNRERVPAGSVEARTSPCARCPAHRSTEIVWQVAPTARPARHAGL